MKVDQVIQELKELGDPKDREGMGRFGISTEKAFGIRIPEIRKLARKYKKDHSLALALWETGYHEARILAALIDDPKLVTETQMENWLAGFNSWDLVDQCCMNLFDKTPRAHQKAKEWTTRKPEFEKRAGFSMMATLAVHDKKASDESFEAFFPLIEKEAGDNRNFVKKAVNWALRQIGKRNLGLNKKAIEVARRIRQQESSSAKWIGSDALRELDSPVVRERVARKSG